MEKLSCNPKYKAFFENIKAVWLQGCRTLGQKVVPNSSGCQQQTAMP